MTHAHRVVRREEMVKERLALLEKEKQLTKLQDEVSAQRRDLPWVKMETDYVFEGADGPVRLSQLFRNTQSNHLIIEHVMFPGDWEKACPSCSCWVDGVNGLLPHLESKAHFLIVCRAPYEKVAKVAKAKGWKCEALSSAGTDCSFNRDFAVEFNEEEVANKSGVYNYNRSNAWTFTNQYPGVSVFHKDSEGNVYLTYSVYARGLERLNSIWAWLDLLPDGRANADGSGSPDGKGNAWHPKHPEEY